MSKIRVSLENSWYKYRKIFTDSQIADLKTLNRESENCLMSPSAFIAYFSLYRNNWEVGKHKYLKFITSKNLLWLCYSNDYDPWSIVTKTKNTLFEYMNVEEVYVICDCLCTDNESLTYLDTEFMAHTIDEIIDNLSYVLCCDLRNVKECTKILYERMYGSINCSYSAEAYTFAYFGLEYRDVANKLQKIYNELIFN